MLKIRPSQMGFFAQASESDFVRRLCLHLRRHHGRVTENYPDGLFEQMVRSGIARARGRGLTVENKIAFFVALMFEIAPNFDEQRMIRRILEDERRPADEQIEMLAEWTTDADWREAGREADATAWGKLNPEARR
jgi:hypothetical protein